MNNKVLTFSLMLAALAVFFVHSYVSSMEDETRKKFGTDVLVVKASRDIKEQETINEKMLELEKIPRTFLEPSAVSFDKGVAGDTEVTKSLKSLTGSVALVPIKKGEQISFNKLSEPGIRTGLSPQVTPGRRAVSISVGEVSSIAKLVKPGDRVDLITIVDMGGGKGNRIAKTLLQDVVVLATGRNVNNNSARVTEPDPGNDGKTRVRSLAEDASFSTVTVEVEPAQAQMLALVASGGESSVILSLRNNDDSDRVNLGSTMYSDVLGPDQARLMREPAAAVRK
jgi:pilus assembly protein CpaB